MSIQSDSTKSLVLKDLSRQYKVHEKDSGMAASLKSLFKRKWKTIDAASDISFEVERGKIVGFLGPNGAGKTTTIKMCCGLLYPTSGEVSVLGHNPWKRENEFLKKITLIMGRRNQMIWDVPAIESYEFFRAIYGIDHTEYKKTLDELTDLLELGPLLNKPVRNLSLGERMKCQLTGALLHRPQVLFLDEPTIGLDVVAQYRFRQYIADYNKKYGATVLLTTHYMGDVEDLCERVIFVDKGKLIFDGNIEGLVEKFLPFKIIELRLIKGMHSDIDFTKFGEISAESDGQMTIRVPKKDTQQIVAHFMSNLQIEDVSVSNPPITDVVRYIYEEGFASN